MKAFKEGYSKYGVLINLESIPLEWFRWAWGREGEKYADAN